MIVTCVHVHVKPDSVVDFIEASVQNHKDHYLEWRDKVKEMMAEQRYGIKYNIIEPKDRKEW